MTTEHRKADSLNHKRWYANHSGEAKQRVHDWLEVGDNREWHNFRQTLYSRKMTLDEYHSKAESQDFCCAICHQEAELVIDHNHTTGKSRGLLCRRCNNGLGHFLEDAQIMDNAKKYLTSWSTHNNHFRQSLSVEGESEGEVA